MDDISHSKTALIIGNTIDDGWVIVSPELGHKAREEYFKDPEYGWPQDFHLETSQIYDLSPASRWQPIIHFKGKPVAVSLFMSEYDDLRLAALRAPSTFLEDLVNERDVQGTPTDSKFENDSEANISLLLKDLVNERPVQSALIDSEIKGNSETDISLTTAEKITALEKRKSLLQLITHVTQ